MNILSYKFPESRSFPGVGEEAVFGVKMIHVTRYEWQTV